VVHTPHLLHKPLRPDGGGAREGWRYLERLRHVVDGEAEARGAPRHNARPQRCRQGASCHSHAAHAQAQLIAALLDDSTLLEGSSLLDLDLELELARRCVAQRAARGRYEEAAVAGRVAPSEARGSGSGSGCAAVGWGRC
jgi:hypothetical protein